MSMIGTFNRAVSNAINKGNEDYVAIIGVEGFTPESVIVTSDDFNCGALCNELEFLRTVSNYYVQSFDLDIAEDENLEALITAFVDLPRRNQGEPDTTYRNRFRSIVVAQSNPRRTTKWAIIDAILHFVADPESIQIVEPFDSDNLYFQIRIEGAVDYDDAIFINNVNQAYINQNFVGGEGVGEVISYLGNIIDRIRAAGVDYDIIFIKQFRFTKTSDCITGSVQFYKAVDAVITRTEQMTKTVDAVIV